MLTKDLLRHRLHDGRIQPQLLKSTPAIVALAQQLLDFWDAGVGRCLGELDGLGPADLLIRSGSPSPAKDAVNNFVIHAGMSCVIYCSRSSTRRLCVPSACAQNE